MKVQCGQCPAKYAVSDERIQDKKVRIHCKRCGASIVVDGKVDPPLVTSTPARPQRPGNVGSDVPPHSEPEPESRPSPRPVAHTMMGGLEAPAAERLRARPSPPPRPVRSPGSPARPEDEPRAVVPANHAGLGDPSTDQSRWRVALTKQDLRWMTTNEIVDAYRTGAVKLETFVFRAGMPTWVTLLEVPEIAEALSDAALGDATEGAPAAAAPPTAPPPAQPVAAPPAPAQATAAQPIVSPAAPRKPPPRALATGGSAYGNAHDPSEPLPFALVPERSNGGNAPAAAPSEQPSIVPPFVRPALEPAPAERASQPAFAAAPLPVLEHAPAPAPFAAAHAASGSSRWIWVAVVLVLLGAVVALIGPRYGLKLL